MMSTSSPAVRVFVITGMLATLAVWTHARPMATAAAPDLEMLPVGFDGWTGHAAPPLDPDVARVLAADRYLRRYYTNGEVTVEMDVAYYARPRVGAAMHSPLNCLPGNGWQVISQDTTPMGAGAVTVRRLVVARAGQRIAMTYWFQNKGGVVAGEYAQRLRLLTDGVRGRPTDAALVRVMMPLGAAPAAGDATLLAFSGHVLGALGRAFRQEMACDC